VYIEFWTGTFPWQSFHSSSFPMPAAILGLVAWVLLLVIIRRLWLARINAEVNVGG
jgi:hypothetical protein